MARVHIRPHFQFNHHGRQVQSHFQSVPLSVWLGFILLVILILTSIPRAAAIMLF